MGFLGSIGSFFSGAVKKVVKTVANPAKLTTAIGTGGLSVLAPKTFAPVTQAVQSTLFNPALASKVLSLTPAGRVGTLALPNVGGSNMGLNLSGILGGISSGIGTLLGGGSPSSALTSFTNFLPSLGTGGPFGAPTTQQPGFPVAASGAQAMARVGAVVGRSFFNKFPNLATAIQFYRNQGKNVTRAKLWSLVKRFGPEIIISGGILSAAAVSELMVAGPGRRRMNPANVKALRRSLRRLESFHHLCARVDRLRRPRSRKTTKAGSATFVRQG